MEENNENMQSVEFAEFKEKFENRRRRTFKKRIIKAVVAVVLILLVWYVADTCHEALNLNLKENVTVSIAGGEDIDEIADILYDAGALKHKFVFKTVAKLKGLDSGFAPGKYTLSEGMKYTYVLRMMINDYSEQQVTLAEGLTKKEIYSRIAKTGYVTVSELEEAEKKLGEINRENPLEGYLFPETYSFSNKQTAEQMLYVMLNQFESVFSDEYKSRAKELNMSVDEVVIFASVIQAETAGEDNMKKVASVFYNRLKRGDKMQSCATVQYILGERKSVLSAEDIKIDSPYNTYMYDGLPHGPVCSPSKMAIEAVLYPADTSYYYFQSDLDGNMYFSESFAEHEQIRKRIQGE